MNERICALTGHRKLPGSFRREILYDTLATLVGKGYETFCCGMARGFDLEALDCLVDLKQRYHVRIEACIPYSGQETGFPAADRKRYKELLSFCDEKTVLSPRYFPGCFLARDRYMVEKCDLLLAYCVREKGGAAYTVRYAERCGVTIVKI